MKFFLERDGERAKKFLCPKIDFFQFSRLSSKLAKVAANITAELYNCLDYLSRLSGFPDLFIKDF